MLITLFLWILKTYIVPAIRRKRAVPRLPGALCSGAAACLLGIAALTTMAHGRVLSYRVLHKGDVVGHMRLDQTGQGADRYLSLVSDVRMRMLFSVTVHAEERSHYQNGRLISSNVYRRVNGREGANRQTKASGGRYQTNAEGRSGTVNTESIDLNLILLYVQEPVGAAQVYSDNFQQFLKIRKTDTHTYRVDLPDGNYNYYSYSNGICSRVEIHQALYRIEMLLT